MKISLKMKISLSGIMIGCAVLGYLAFHSLVPTIRLRMPDALFLFLSTIVVGVTVYRLIEHIHSPLEVLWWKVTLGALMMIAESFVMYLVSATFSYAIAGLILLVGAMAFLGSLLENLLEEAHQRDTIGSHDDTIMEGGYLPDTSWSITGACIGFLSWIVWYGLQSGHY